MSSSILSCKAAVSRFWVFWIKNTIKLVMIVVVVLMMSCQVSLKPKIGPLMAQTMTQPSAMMNAIGCPTAFAMAPAKRENQADRPPDDVDDAADVGDDMAPPFRRFAPRGRRSNARGRTATSPYPARCKGRTSPFGQRDGRLEFSGNVRIRASESGPRPSQDVNPGS